MSALRKERLLRETLGEHEGEMPTAEGILFAATVIAGLLVFVLFVG
jgi:hypothetical protein